MRTEQEMFELILNNAEENKHIRAVYMNGSRANPNAPKDKYRDFDIVYVAADDAPPFNDRQWICPFGEPAVCQEPDLNDCAWGAKHDFTQRYSWQLLLHDGNRIDLTVCTKQAMLNGYTNDGLTVPLLDKDGCLPEISGPDDREYHIKKPTKAQFAGVTNNFWWCLQNVAKGIARDELTYAMNMYIQVVHKELERMVEWYIGGLYDFSVNAGKWGKYYKKYLPENIYNMYVKTYSDANHENLWGAVFTACELFGTIAPAVGGRHGYVYNGQEDKNMTDYLLKMKNGTL